MKNEKKVASPKKESNVKDKMLIVLKKVFTAIKKFILVLGKKIGKFSKLKIGKFNGGQVLVVLALVVLLFIFGGNMFKGENVADYPVIYNNTDGDLYLVDKNAKNEEKAVKLANGESVNNVVYANTTNRYILFQKNEALYLYDSKKKDETTKIVSGVESYSFSKDDKYVIAISEDKKLHIYNFKETFEVEEDIDNVAGVTEDKIMYEKENTLYVRSINPKKDDKLKVTEDYDTYVKFSEDGKNIMYINGERELYSFNVKKDKNEKIAKNVANYYCDTKSCEKLYYVENDSSKVVYYYDGKGSQKIIKDIYNIYAYNVEEKQVVYSTIEDGEYTLYYKKGTKDAVKIESKLDSIRTVKIFEGKEIYYITGDQEVKYVKISGAKLGNVKTIGSDVVGFLYLHKNGYAFVGDVKDNSSGKLYFVKNGKVREIDENVNSSFITISNNGKKLYYMKDYQTTGDLFVTSGGKGKEVEKDVYNFEYVKDDLIYLIKDYSTAKSRGSLYRYTGKTVKIADNVTRIAPSPVIYQSK